MNSSRSRSVTAVDVETFGIISPISFVGYVQSRNVGSHKQLAFIREEDEGGFYREFRLSHVDTDIPPQVELPSPFLLRHMNRDEVPEHELKGLL